MSNLEKKREALFHTLSLSPFLTAVKRMHFNLGGLSIELITMTDLALDSFPNHSIMVLSRKRDEESVAHPLPTALLSVATNSNLPKGFPTPLRTHPRIMLGVLCLLTSGIDLASLACLVSVRLRFGISCWHCFIQIAVPDFEIFHVHDLISTAK